MENRGEGAPHPRGLEAPAHPPFPDRFPQGEQVSISQQMGMEAPEEAILEQEVKALVEAILRLEPKNPAECL